MQRNIRVEAHWDAEAEIWLAASPDVPGLVVEAKTWTGMIRDVRDILPDLLQLQGRSGSVALTFRAEEHLTLADL